MTREDLIAQLELLPPGTEIFLRVGDNAWTPRLRAFEERGTVVGYVDVALVPEHRNWPAEYRGAKELLAGNLPLEKRTTSS